MRLNHGQFLIDGVYPSPVAVHDRAGNPALLSGHYHFVWSHDFQKPKGLSTVLIRPTQMNLIVEID
jgi:hypothetical protein